MKYVTVLEIQAGGKTDKRIIAAGTADVCALCMNNYVKNNPDKVDEKVYITSEKEYLREIKPPTGKQILMES